MELVELELDELELVELDEVDELDELELDELELDELELDELEVELDELEVVVVPQHLVHLSSQSEHPPDTPLQCGLFSQSISPSQHQSPVSAGEKPPQGDPLGQSQQQLQFNLLTKLSICS